MPRASAWDLMLVAELAFRVLEAAGFLLGDVLVAGGVLVLLTFAEDP